MANTDGDSGGSSNNTSSILSNIVSTYKDRSDSCSNPSLVQSMLRNTTETGDIGVLSIVPDGMSLPNHRQSSGPDRTRSRASTVSKRHKSSRFYGHGEAFDSRTSLRGQEAAEVLSIYRAGTPGSQYTRASSLRNESHISLSNVRCPSQADLQLLPRPRSPFPYPTRLKRPGYRSSSPSLVDFNGTDTRTYVGLEQGHMSHPPAVLLDYHGRVKRRNSLATNTIRPCSGPHGGANYRLPLPPACYNAPIHKSHRAPSIQSTRSQELFLINKTNSISPQQFETAKRPLGTTYYDYSENFSGQTEKPVSNPIAYQDLGQIGSHLYRSRTANGGSLRSRTNTKLTRAQSSMIVHLDEHSLNAPAGIRQKNKDKLAEWEQIGISSKPLDAKQRRSRPASPVNDVPNPTCLVTDKVEEASAGLPIGLLDGSSSVEKLASNNNVNAEEEEWLEEGDMLPEKQVEEFKASERNSQENARPSTAGAEDRSKQVIKYSPQGITDTHVPVLPSAEETDEFPQPKIVRVSALTDIQIQSPRPERPISYRNPNDRLSRILSIAESFSDEDTIAARPRGKRLREVEPKECTNVNKRAASLENGTGNTSNNRLGVDEESQGLQWPFSRLRNHFSKAHMPRQKHSVINSSEQGNTRSTKFQVENTALAAQETKSQEAHKSGESFRKYSAAETQKLNTVNYRPPSTERPANDPENYEKSSLRQNTGKEELTNPVQPKNGPASSFYSLPSYLSADFITTDSPLKPSEQQQADPTRLQPSNSAPRICLHPPTPSLGLGDVAGVLSNSNSIIRPPTSLSAGIVDAELVSTPPSTASGQSPLDPLLELLQQHAEHGRRDGGRNAGDELAAVHGLEDARKFHGVSESERVLGAEDEEEEGRGTR
ncbi:MAG: hypothetical protein LQ340_003991 [Diploschistes diacapsis]|nr:MAG: hypothetical protein LQ340_003991 [Diploschistes diacapsis]